MTLENSLLSEVHMLRELVRSKGGVKCANEQRLVGFREGNGSNTAFEAAQLSNELSLLERQKEDIALEGQTQYLAVSEFNCLKLLCLLFLHHLKVSKLVLRLKIVTAQDVDCRTVIQAPPHPTALHVTYHHIRLGETAQRQRNIHFIPEIILLRPKRNGIVPQDRCQPLLLLRPRNPRDDGISLRNLQFGLQGLERLKATIEYAYFSGGVINGEEAIGTRREEALCYSPIQMQILIYESGSFLQSLTFLQHLPQYLRCEDLLLDGIGNIHAYWVQLLSKHEFLIGSGHLLSDDGGEVVEGDLRFAELKAGILEEPKEPVGEVELFFRRWEHDGSQDTEEGSDGECRLLLHDLLDLYQVFLRQPLHNAFAGEFIHARVLGQGHNLLSQGLCSVLELLHNLQLAYCTKRHPCHKDLHIEGCR